MAILYNKISSTIPASNTLPNAALTYNFNNVTLSGVDTTDQRYANIDLSFPGYSAFIKASQNSQLLKTIKTTPTSNNITYYDTIVNSTKQYKIKYIHVGISPLSLNQIYSWCVMLDLVSTALETLIIIIPLNYVSLISTVSDAEIIKNENPDFSKLLYNCNNSANNAIDINKFIVPRNYTTIYKTANSANNRAIILNGSITTYFYDIINSSKVTLKAKYINNIYLESTIYRSQTNVQLKSISTALIYLCVKLPIKTNDILKNDIYIDCYKVGESSTIVGGIKNPLSSVSNSSKANEQTQIALFGIILAFLIIYGFYKLYQMNNKPKLNTAIPNIQGSNSRI